MTLHDSAVDWFLAEYPDIRHAVLDWRLGYSVVKRLLGPLAGRRVLDYGCGDGRFTRLLRDRGGRMIGVDVSAEAVARARRKDSRHIDYHVIGSGDLDVVPPASVDLAAATFVLCCVQDRGELLTILEAIRGRLRPGGVLVVSEPHPGGVGRKFYSMRRVVQGEPRIGAPITVHLECGGGVLRDYWRPREEYDALLARAGFAVECAVEPTMADYPDEPHWKDERRFPPFLIIRARA